MTLHSPVAADDGHRRHFPVAVVELEFPLSQMPGSDLTWNIHSSLRKGMYEELSTLRGDPPGNGCHGGTAPLLIGLDARYIPLKGDA